MTGMKVLFLRMQLNIVVHHVCINAEGVHDALGQTLAPVLPLVVVALLLLGILDKVVALMNAFLVCQRLELGADRHLMAGRRRNLERIGSGSQLVV